VIGEDNRIENLEQERYCSLVKMLRGPVRDTVRARSLAGLETPDGFMNLVGLVILGSLAGARN